MNRRRFLRGTAALTASVPFSSIVSPLLQGEESADDPVAVLLIDTDRGTKPISQGIYGQFLEHINHSVEDGLFAEQIRGAGFEGKDFETYWTSGAASGEVALVD